MNLTDIHSDSRGSIRILTGEPLTYPEVTVFETKKGYARGGCIHKINDEYTSVIEGFVKYIFSDGTEHSLYPGVSLRIPKNTGHCFISATDSVVLEWGATPEEKQKKYPSLRRLVDRINEQEDNYMKIDIFKDGLFETLTPFNQDVLDVCEQWNYNAGGQEYDFSQKRVSNWFDPKKLRNIYIPASYPHHVPLTDEAKWSLQLYCCNYMTLFVVNKLYADRKDVLIEDVGSGMGRLGHYLHKSGFTNLSFQDDFSQTDQRMFEDMMKKSGIDNYKLNDKLSRPIVMTQVALPAIIKSPVTDTELYCFYNNVPRISVEEVTKNYGLQFLARDADDLMFVYCKADKYDEFLAKLKPYEVA